MNENMNTSPQLQRQPVRTVEPVASIRSLREYVSQECLAPIDLKLDANEGPMVHEEQIALKQIPLINQATSWDREAIRKYPSREELERNIARRFDVDDCQVVVTAGADDAIDRVCRAFLQDGRNIVFPEPSFVMIRKYATMAGSEIRSVPWPDGPFPVEQVIASADENTAVVALVSPNNPTGQTITPEQILVVAMALPRCILLVDQAYAEFESGGMESLTQLSLRELPNTVVVRTFSKAWGMAGLRVGYAIGPRAIIDCLRSVGSPYPVSGPSLAIVAETLTRQPEGDREYIARVQKERQELRRLLNSCQVDALPSQANFVFARFSGCRLTAGFVFQALAAQGILVRFFGGSENALRITCPGDEIAFERLCKTLRSILAPEAVLFDMDGVLVDEAASYREAIRLTCESYGETFSATQIAEAKLNGNANNDWKFTQCILRERGCDAEFEEIRDRFENFYQGTADSPGLWQQERRLFDPDWLKSLASRYPLAIVTGRPRSDALRFLEANSVRDLFTVVVSMEDGPAKPDPAPVKTAVEQLGVQSAWMIGDTPDDINAARSAGLPALGIVAPRGARADSTKKLNAAFAATILENLKSLDELLP